jgi:hypothetical protein
MKPRYKQDKRQKEIARKQKQDRKKVEKLQRKDQPDDVAGGSDAASSADDTALVRSEDAPSTAGDEDVPAAD